MNTNKQEIRQQNTNEPLYDTIFIFDRVIISVVIVTLQTMIYGKLVRSNH